MSSEEAEALRRRSSKYTQTYEFHVSRGMYALAIFDLSRPFSCTSRPGF